VELSVIGFWSFLRESTFQADVSVAGTFLKKSCDPLMPVPDAAMYRVKISAPNRLSVPPEELQESQLLPRMTEEGPQRALE
jgi:hypothetical protein